MYLSVCIDTLSFEFSRLLKDKRDYVKADYFVNLPLNLIVCFGFFQCQYKNILKARKESKDYS